MIIREFRCGDCGALFESSEKPEDVECPQCTAQEPERVFLTPPAVRSPDTSRKDTIVRELAADFGLSNVSNRHGEAVKRANPQNAAQFADGASPVIQKLGQLGSQADGFSSVGSVLAGKGPNAHLPSSFPHQNRQRLKKS